MTVFWFPAPNLLGISLQDAISFENLSPSGPSPSGSAHPFVCALLVVSSLGCGLINSQTQILIRKTRKPTDEHTGNPTCQKGWCVSPSKSLSPWRHGQQTVVSWLPSEAAASQDDWATWFKYSVAWGWSLITSVPQKSGTRSLKWCLCGHCLLGLLPMTSGKLLASLCSKFPINEKGWVNGLAKYLTCEKPSSLYHPCFNCPRSSLLHIEVILYL